MPRLAKEPQPYLTAETLMTLVRSQRSPLAPAGQRRLQPLLRSFARLHHVWRCWHARQAVRRLMTASDRQLDDIGLMRGDVASALLHGWAVDPSEKLAETRHERMRAQRAARRRPAAR